MHLADLLAAAYGSSTVDAAGAHSINRHWLALTAIRETETIRVRLKIMNTALGDLLKERDTAKSLYPKWELLDRDLQKRSRERNAVVHGQWLLSDDFPGDLILEARDGSYKRYTLSDLEQILDRLVDLTQACWQLMLAVLNAKQEGLLLP